MATPASSASTFTAWKSTRILGGPMDTRIRKLGPFDSSFAIGGCLPATPTNYLIGRVTLIKVLNNRYDPQTMIVNGFKLEHMYSNENDDLLAYFNFNSTERGTFPNNEFVFSDNSKNFK